MKKKIPIYGSLLAIALLIIYAVFRLTERDPTPSGPAQEVSENDNTRRSMDGFRKRELSRQAGEKAETLERVPTLYTRPFNQAGADLRNDPTDPRARSEFAIQLDDPNLTEAKSVEQLAMLLFTYRQRAGGGSYHSDENLEVTNALLGDNPKKIAFLSADNSRINSKGELVDRFKTPYHFHLISSERLITRSAGEDKVLHTDDDVISATDDEIKNGVSVSGRGGIRVAP